MVRRRGLKAAGGAPAWPGGRLCGLAYRAVASSPDRACQRRAHRVEARGAAKPVCLDGAPDCRGYGCVLVVGKIDCRHG
jgi:hypothetical protein